MKTKKYQIKPRLAEVVEFDGTMAGGYEIIAWLWRNEAARKGTVHDGYKDQGPNYMEVAGVKTLPGDYVVLSLDDKSVYVYKKEKFAAVFDEVPNV